MRKILLAAFLLVATSTLKAQTKDSVMVQITMDTTSYKKLVYAIQAYIDSKQVTKELLDIINKNAQLVADKPKDIVEPKKK